MQKNINLIFLNVPHNEEYSNRIKDFGLEDEEAKYKQDMKEFEKFIDYDFPNEITRCKNCFTDPIHTNDSINLIIAKEIYLDSLVIGKKL